MSEGLQDTATLRHSTYAQYLGRKHVNTRQLASVTFARNKQWGRRRSKLGVGQSEHTSKSGHEKPDYCNRVLDVAIGRCSRASRSYRILMSQQQVEV